MQSKINSPGIIEEQSFQGNFGADDGAEPPAATYHDFLGGNKSEKLAEIDDQSEDEEAAARSSAINKDKGNHDGGDESKA